MRRNQNDSQSQTAHQLMTNPYVVVILFLCLAVCFPGCTEKMAVGVIDAPILVKKTPEQDPIPIIGHGSMFDQSGNELRVTPERLKEAQDHYLDKLEVMLTPAEKKKYLAERRRFDKFNDRNRENTKYDWDQLDLIINASHIDWLLNEMSIVDSGALQGKNNFIKDKLKVDIFNSGKAFDLPEGLKGTLNSPEDFIVLMATTLGGAAYIAECEANQVPIPPDWGSTSWKSTGTLINSEEFISRSQEARPFVYKSSAPDPEGTCIALPRFRNNPNTGDPEHFLLGIICQGIVTGKSCFWDNQTSGGAVWPVPLSGPNDVGSRPLSDFQGGADLFGGAGGICTGCHAGENSFNIHPATALGEPALDSTAHGDVQLMPDVWQDPIVHAMWPQNEFQSTLITRTEATKCVGCHSSAAGEGGRFPKLSNELISGYDADGDPVPGYCEAVLKNAINIASGDPANTMPKGGSLSGTEHSNLVVLIDDFCDGLPSNAEGEPHMRTTNGIHYDFQADGEFTLLKDNAGFEVQARQQAMATPTFFPNPNNHTGLATCVSANTAVAAKVGGHRVSYQPDLNALPIDANMKLRIDGVITPLTYSGVSLPSGGRVKKSPVDGLEIEFPNGEILRATPGYWSFQNLWYLNVNITNAEANQGVIGSVKRGDWLPALPNGTSLGQKPTSTNQRYQTLNKTFANAWRVNKSTSLFDYPGGMSTDDFTLPDWPKDSPPCEVPDRKMANPVNMRVAKKACVDIRDKNRKANCEFDVALTGELGFAKTYMRTEKLERWATVTKITLEPLRKQERDTQRKYLAKGLVATVMPTWGGLNRAPKGSVQFYMGEKPLSKPIRLNRMGQAVWTPKELTDETGRKMETLSARYSPSKDTLYLTSWSKDFK